MCLPSASQISFHVLLVESKSPPEAWRQESLRASDPSLGSLLQGEHRRGREWALSDSVQCGLMWKTPADSHTGCACFFFFKKNILLMWTLNDQSRVRCQFYTRGDMWGSEILFHILNNLFLIRRAGQCYRGLSWFSSSTLWSLLPCSLLHLLVEHPVTSWH